METASGTHPVHTRYTPVANVRVDADDTAGKCVTASGSVLVARAQSARTSPRRSQSDVRDTVALSASPAASPCETRSPQCAAHALLAPRLGTTASHVVRFQPETDAWSDKATHREAGWHRTRKGERKGHRVQTVASHTR